MKNLPSVDDGEEGDQEALIKTNMYYKSFLPKDEGEDGDRSWQVNPAMKKKY